MANPFRALWSAIRDFFDELFILLLCNLIWAAMCLPAVYFAYLALAAGSSFSASLALLVGVLPAGPATAGLSYISYRVSDGRAVKLSDFFAGLRSHARQGWAVVGAFTVGLLIILFNLGFYGRQPNIISGLLLGLWIYLLVFWSAMLIYSFPLLFLQEQPDLRIMARNAALMVVSRPVFTFVTLLLMFAILILSTMLIIPLLLLTPALLNIWSTRATRYLVKLAEDRKAAQEDASPTPSDEKGRKGQIRPK